MKTRFAALLLLSAPLAQSSTTGKVPLPDLGTGTYKSFEGGLYPSGQNVPPPAHLSAALLEAAQIVPRDASGNPSATGRIGFASIGMSNTTHEFGHFERQQDKNPERDPRVYVLTASQGGQDASITANPSAPYWTIVSQRVSAAGLTPAQVQVAWLKNAQAGPSNNFPLHAQALQADLAATVRNLRAKYPNLRLCYVSPRTYGGYAAPGSLNPEPQAYESGFSVKWMIEQQIDGDASLNWDPQAGAVVAPLLLWGPYLWADGINPSSTGLTWLSSDFEADHTHPSASGEAKVALLLHQLLAADPSAQLWYRSHGAPIAYAVDATDDAYVSSAAPSQNFGSATELQSAAGANSLTSYVRFDLGGVDIPIQAAKLSFRLPTNAIGGAGALRGVANTSWSQSTITFANAPAPGEVIKTGPGCSRDGTVSFDVSAAVLSDVDHIVSFALAGIGGVGILMSKESGQAPRLVLTLARTPDAEPYGCGLAPPGSLRPLVGAPALGTTLVVGLDNPLGTQAAGSYSFLAYASAPDPAFPCGTILPSWGMASPSAPGEFLLALAPPNPILLPAGPLWSGPGSPAPFALPIPQTSSLLGAQIYLQGALLDLSNAAAPKIGLSEGLQLSIVPGPLSSAGGPP